jgi:transposase
LINPALTCFSPPHFLQYNIISSFDNIISRNGYYVNTSKFHIKNGGGEKHVKAGFIKGEQRYLCKECGCKFVPTRQRGKSEKEKLLAVWLYCHGLSFRTIAKLFHVNVRSVFNWVKAFARANYTKPEPISEAVIVELDEIWHYLHSKKHNAGYGKLIAVIPVNLSTGNVEGEIMLHLQGFTSD